MYNEKTEKDYEGTKLTARQREAAINGLERMADVIRETGWGQGEEEIFEYNERTGEDKLVGYCALGALRAARAPKGAFLALGVYLNRRAKGEKFVDGDICTAEDLIMEYNDCNETKRGDVLRSIKGACTALRNETI